MKFDLNTYTKENERYWWRTFFYAELQVTTLGTLKQISVWVKLLILLDTLHM